MRIAFFNWRDIRNPLAGGAEVYCQEVLRRLSERHEATLFTSRFPGSAGRESIDGVEHIRFGGRYSIYARAYSCYKKHIEGRYDIIVESVNGVPFFTPLFAREPVVPFIHQLTRENWYSGIWFPAALAGYFAEDFLLSLYRKMPAIVPSDSTRKDLLALGFGDVNVVHGAARVERPRIKREPRSLLYLGRLTRSKRVDHAIRAFATVKEKFPRAVLKVAGSGPEEKRLSSLARSLGLSDSVIFLGRVGEDEKARLLAGSSLMLFPGVREGWGLVVLEANSCGTPVLGYGVPGLRDSIRDGVNGYAVRNGDIAALAGRACGLLSRPSELGRLSASSSAYARKFSWERTARQFERILMRAVEG